MNARPDVPAHARFVVVGGGVHGLSTAAHLAERLGSGDDVLVVDKARAGAGASGISGGIVRNFYAAPEMHELVRRSVDVFELDPQLFGFRQVGYVAVVPEAQATELERIAEHHREAGYASTLVTGARRVAAYLRERFPDWRARGSAALLHEHRSGWADASTTVAALAGLVRAAGVRVAEGVEVTGFELRGGAVEAAETTAGRVACDAVVVAPGPWARELWRLLELPDELDGGGARTAAFRYWQVREGEYAHRRAALDPAAPVVHLDADEPASPHLPAHWGVYFRPGLGGGVAAGGLPVPLEPGCELDPYGPSHPDLGRTAPAFDHAVEDALAWALGRFDGPRGDWTASSFGAPTCFTPDAYPVVGFVRENAYAVLDSNHGFKLLALGELAAAELLGACEPALEPFRLERFARAAPHPVSASPYPWT